MNKRYLYGIYISILVLGLNQVFIQYFLFDMQSDGTRINVAGRQRMLSQLINLEYYKLQSGLNREDILINNIKEWNNAHIALINGSIAYKINALSNTNIKQRLLQLSPFIDTISSLLLEKKISNTELAVIDRNQSAYLVQMDQIVSLLEANAQKKLWFVIVIEIILMLVSLTVLVLEVKWIYMPISKKLQETIKDLLHSENMLQAVYNSSNEAITFIDKNFKIQFNNVVAQKIAKQNFGRKAKIGDHSLDYNFPEYKSKTKAIYQEVLGGSTLDYVDKVAEDWWEYKLYPVKSDGEITGLARFEKNITQRKVLEERLQIIASNFPNGSITLLDQQLNIIYTNGEGYKDFGIDPSKLYGKHISSLLLEDRIDKFNAVIPEVLAGENAEYQVELKGKTYLMRLKPIGNDLGKVDKIIVLSIDITDIIAFQEKIRQQNEKLKDISWTQSHEVRGPLSSMMGLLELLQTFEYKDKNQQLYFNYLLQSCNELDSVIKKIVETSNK